MKLTIGNSFAMLIFLSAIAISCEDAVTPVRTFIINKDDHYASPRITESQLFSFLEFEAMFDNSAMYDLGDPALQTNKNKLMGFSDCNSLHHENSARFAWQWYNNQLEIFAYTYVGGERQEVFMGAVELNQFNHFRLGMEDNYYVFQLNHSEPVKMPRGNVCDRGVYYKLWPYFGGAVPAPHDVRIAIKTIY
jgi:hypothetical protein